MTEPAKSKNERKKKDQQIHVPQSLRQMADHMETVESGSARTEGSVRKEPRDHLQEELVRFYGDAPIGLCYFDRNIRFLMINDWLAAINGLSVDDHLGRRISEVLPEVAVGVEAQLRQVLDTGEPIIGGEVDAETPAHPGLIRSFRHNYFAVKSDTGTVLGVGCVVEEITEWKQAEAAWRDNEALFRATIDTAVDGMILIDAAGKVLVFNKACEQLFGYTADEVIGQNVKMLMPPPYREEHDGYLGRYLETGEKKIIGIGREVIGWRKDGSTLPLELSIGEVDQGGMRAFVGVIRDISDRKRLAWQRLHAEKMEALGVLAGGIAHEFNNMLFAMIGLTESARNTLSEGSEERTDLEGVLEAGERAQELVQQILAFSRQDKPHPHLIDLQHTVTGALRLVRATLPATITVRQSLDEISQPVLADPTHVHQIILNLASNAADAMKANGGLLDIRLDQVIAEDQMIARVPELSPGPYSRLTVRDTGCGMDDRILDRIFDPFFTTKEVGVGTGMGLAAVHGIVRRYGGAIDVSSELGRGSTFEIYLPLWSGEDQEGLKGGAARPEQPAGVGG